MRLVFALAATATCVVALASSPAAAVAQTAEVAIDGVRREVPVLERQGRRFVALDEVARLLGGEVDRGDGERSVLTVDGAELVVMRRVPYVRFDGRWYQMSEPAQRDARGFWIPAGSLHHLLPVLLPGRFPRGTAAPRPGAEPPPRETRPEEGGVESGMIGRADRGVDVRIEAGRTRLGFRLDAVPEVVVDDAVPGALQLRLAGSTVPAAMVAGLTGVGLVDSVSMAEADDGTMLTLWLDRRASMYSVASMKRPVGIEVVLLTADPGAVQRLAAADAGRRAPGPRVDRPRERPRDESTGIEDRRDPGPARARSGDREAPPTRPPANPSRRWTVVLDAGHGGHDPGANGPRGTREKDVTLAVARRLADRLEATGVVDIVLTRSDDSFVALADRRKIANRSNGDLFVSIHANAAENPTAEGFETYYLSTAKTAQALEVARRENASIRYENPEIDAESLDELNFILWDLAQNEFFRESSVLAETVQEELDRRVSLRSRGVKQAPFFVLNGTFMPAILFETAFITNPREESLLNDPEFQTRLVDGLAGSILGFLDRYGRKVVAPTAAR